MNSQNKTGGIKKGDVIKNRYEVLRLIGKGGMSRVFLGADLTLANRQCAIKEVDRQAKDAAGRPIEQSLASEAELLSRLKHPNIVDIIDIDKTDNFIYVIMDHVEGQSLDKIVRENGPQSEEDVQRWMLQICDALGYLHKQNPPIIYRDMKPNNIMLHHDGYVKLIDFGVSREYKDEAKKDTVAFGTHGYAPPEQCGNAQTDARSDIYAVGATMYHLLGGKAPDSEFPLPNVWEVNPNVSEGFADVIIPRCTQLRREDRYQSCEELAADLERYKKLTKEYRAVQKRKVNLFSGLLAASCVFVCCGLVMFGLQNQTINKKYEECMESARNMLEIDSHKASVEYGRAIEYKPDSMAAWDGLLKSYKADKRFEAEKPEIVLGPNTTITEKQQLDNLYGSYLSNNTANPCFAEISYEIGRLYLVDYSYGQTATAQDNQATRIKSSLVYFENASKDTSFDKCQTAEIYYNIALFTSEIDNAIRYGTESEELYKNYWDNLCALSTLIETESDESAKIQSGALIANSLETYMSKFKDYAGIPFSDVLALYNKVNTQIKNTNCIRETGKVLKQETENRMRTAVIKKMQTVYPEDFSRAGI